MRWLCSLLGVLWGARRLSAATGALLFPLAARAIPRAVLGEASGQFWIADFRFRIGADLSPKSEIENPKSEIEFACCRHDPNPVVTTTLEVSYARRRTPLPP